jgi:Nuclease-related domain
LKLNDRLGQWAEIRKVRPIEESPDVAAGRDGELALRELIGSSYRLGDASVFAGRRIPSRRQGRRREIDLIVCTPRVIHLIEAKNWSGRLEVVGGHWRQTRRNGEVVGHGDLLADQRLKRDAVVEYLGDRGLDLDGRFVRDHIAPKVIFTNPRLELHPTVEALPEVISRRELDGYLGRQRPNSLAERMAASVLALCLDREAGMAGGRPPSDSGPIPRDRYAKIVESLAEVGTWDRLELYGTRIVAGDVISLRVGARTYRRPELLERAEHLPIRLRWARGSAWGLFKAVTGLGPLGSLDLGKARIEVSPADTVTFHAVGDKQPSARRLVELDRIVLG